MNQIDVNNKVEMLLTLIGEDEILKKGNRYVYSDIDKKLCNQLHKMFAPDMDIYSMILCYYHESGFLFHNVIKGILFGLPGFYYKSKDAKTYYVNYADIEKIDYVPNEEVGVADKNSIIKIRIKNITDSIIITDNDYNKTKLYEILNLILEKSNIWNDLFCFRQSGIVEPINFSNKEKKECDEIIKKAAIEAEKVVSSDSISQNQVSMVVSLGKIFGLNESEKDAERIIEGAMPFVIRRSTFTKLIECNSKEKESAYRTKQIGDITKIYFKRSRFCRSADNTSESIDEDIEINSDDIKAFNQQHVASIRIKCKGIIEFSLIAKDYQDRIEIGSVISYGDKEDRIEYFDAIIEKFKKIFNKTIILDPKDKELNNRNTGTKKQR